MLLSSWYAMGPLIFANAYLSAYVCHHLLDIESQNPFFFNSRAPVSFYVDADALSFQ